MTLTKSQLLLVRELTDTEDIDLSNYNIYSGTDLKQIEEDNYLSFLHELSYLPFIKQGL